MGSYFSDHGSEEAQRVLTTGLQGKSQGQCFSGKQPREPFLIDEETHSERKVPFPRNKMLQEADVR